MAQSAHNSSNKTTAPSKHPIANPTSCSVKTALPLPTCPALSGSTGAARVAKPSASPPAGNEAKVGNWSGAFWCPAWGFLRPVDSFPYPSYLKPEK